MRRGLMKAAHRKVAPMRPPRARQGTVSFRPMQAVARYDRTAMFLHWLLVIAVLAQVGFGWFLGDVPRGTPARTIYVNLHKSTAAAHRPASSCCGCTGAWTHRGASACPAQSPGMGTPRREDGAMRCCTSAWW